MTAEIENQIKILKQKRSRARSPSEFDAYDRKIADLEKQKEESKNKKLILDTDKMSNHKKEKEDIGRSCER